MSKLHLCNGTVYLDGYINADHDGKLAKDLTSAEVDVNRTSLNKYFKYSFETDHTKRVKREFIVDEKFKILEKWPWKSNSVTEIVFVNALEHFEHKDQVPHIISEAKRVLKKGGIFKFDFPDILEIALQYHDTDPEFCMALIYCNHKNPWSRHEWGYTRKTIVDFFHLKYWDLEFKDVVKHDYPSQGVWATKK